MGLLYIQPKGWDAMLAVTAKLLDHEVDQSHVTGQLQKVIAKSRIKVKAIAQIETYGEIDSESDLKFYQNSLL